ncbi:hypothetical protein BB560_002472 [Smittium megazygosporum]|uniref:Uncharacterized protein n=1 Tax=Smittium megazygosporum TaxID=133381 RepID=A0A2T9ZEV6_9FUNG|nr:hypothetical protein BB560_002472 [Smittium megazygosporum]
MTRKSKKAKLDSSLSSASIINDQLSSAADIQKTVVPNHVLIVVGTYERIVSGLQFSFNKSDSKDEQAIQLEPKFVMPVHISCVTSVAICDKFIASGSSDEVIKLFDLKRNKELGSLHEHSGTIKKLAFYKNTHLLSAATDGKICIYRTTDWEILKVLRGHSDEVNDIAIHPSGKLAISVSKDRTAIVWNLLTGHKATRTKLDSEGESIRFNTDGSRYAILSANTRSSGGRASNKLTIYTLSPGVEPVQCKISSTCHKIMDFEFVCLNGNPDSEYIAFGGSDFKLHFFNTKTESETFSFKAHDNR